jgi:dTDP-4-amino-4,6-dideoxygalactose transaminase
MISYISKPQVDFDLLEEYVSISEKANQFSNDGPLKFLLEDRLTELLRVESGKKLLVCNNGTTALHAIHLFLGMKRKMSRWVSPDFNFPSVRSLNALTDIVDIDPVTCGIPLDADISSYDGVMVTNLFGACQPLSEWTEKCKRENKVLIVDNASSPLSVYKGKTLVNWGDFSFGSLHHTKIIGFGEGGFIVAPEEYYDDLKAILNFGFDIERNHHTYSSNFKMADTTASFILQYLDQFDLKKFLTIQKKLVSELTQNGFKMFPSAEADEIVYGNLPVLFDSPTDHLLFRKNNIEANKYYKPLIGLKNSMEVYSRIVNFPLHQNLTSYEIKLMIKTIKTLL